MAMLAEPKRKQKWSLNPRGKTWTQDTNKFGLKMLKKMGWSHGKGLGANEDGMVEHVKVSYKNDSKGIGYKESDDQWTAHESNFSALLEALGGGEQKTDEIKLKSLEEKSQSSRARVHYKKFTRGKDLSRYSEKDLANIFGKRNLKELRKNKKQEIKMQEESSLENPKNNDEENKKSSLFSNGGLISDYFKKLPNFGKTNDYVVGNNGVLTKADDSESESELRPSFGFGFNSESISNQTELKSNQASAISNENSVSENNNKNEEEIASEKKKKNKNKRQIEDFNETINDTPSKKKKLESQEVHVDTPVKKKKDKSKRKYQIEHESGLSNPAFNPLCTPVKVEKHILEPIEESPSEAMDETLNDTVGHVAASFEVQVQINNESTPVKLKNKEESSDSMKKNKRKEKLENMDISYTNGDRLLSINQSKGKKRKHVKNTEEIDELNISSSNINNEDITENDSIKIRNKTDKKAKKNKTLQTEELEEISSSLKSKKRKSKTKDMSEEGVDNPFFNMSTENEESFSSQIENPYEVKIKEKKKKKSKGEKENYALENPVFNAEDSVISQDVTNEAFEVKRKDKSKKKKKGTEEHKGLDNPALNLNDTMEDCDLMLNVVTTPVIPKEQNKNLDESLSIKKVNEVKRRKSVRFSDVTRERIIPNKEESEQETLEDSREIVEVEGKLNDSSQLSYLDKFVPKKKSKKGKVGLDNSGFDKHANSMEENITSISKTLDNYQAEIENDINEAKLKSVEIEDIMVGEVGNPDGDDEVLPDGSVKLKFRKAKFNKTARYMDGLTGAKKSYKHLIRGDIVMNFKEANLHQIGGYAVVAR